jgi:hypothetical protein
VLVVRDRLQIRREPFREFPRLHDLVVLAGRERGFDRLRGAPASVGVYVTLPQRIGRSLDDGRSGRRV